LTGLNSRRCPARDSRAEVEIRCTSTTSTTSPSSTYFQVSTWIARTVSALLNPAWATWGTRVILRGWLGLSQELAGGGKVAGCLVGAGVVVPGDAPCPGEGVFAELLGCLKLTQCQERGGEFVCDFDGVVALLTEDSLCSGKRVLAELSRCLMFTECVQVASEVGGEAQGPGMVLAKYSLCPGEAVLMHLSGFIDLAERV